MELRNKRTDRRQPEGERTAMNTSANPGNKKVYLSSAVRAPLRTRPLGRSTRVHAKGRWFKCDKLGQFAIDFWLQGFREKN